MSGGVSPREVYCRSILSRSGIPGFDWSINPYTGCLHDCAYCYALYMRRFTGHREPWGRFLDVKLNAPRILARALRRTPPSSIFMSSVTDPYQPAERRYELTRRLLEILAPLPHALSIHTKSSLVTRDIDLLRRCREPSVTFTIVTADERAARCLEPGASPVGERIRALERLARAGVRTGVFIAPVIPYVTERRLEGLLAALARAGVREVGVDDLHYADRIASRLLPALRAWSDEAARRYLRTPRNYTQHLGRYVLQCCRALGIRCTALC
ncbi:MAG: radical SAM protein [bacterium]|nr:radical SAM protein [bacterium]